MAPFSVIEKYVFKVNNGGTRTTLKDAILTSSLLTLNKNLSLGQKFVQYGYYKLNRSCYVRSTCFNWNIWNTLNV